MCALSLTKGHDGYAMLVGEAHYLHHLIAALRVDYSLGPNRRVVGEDAAPVTLQLAFTRDARSSGRMVQFREQVHALVCLDGVGEGSEALYLDGDLISCLQPDLRVAGCADAWWRACDYDVARDEGHALGEKGD